MDGSSNRQDIGLQNRVMQVRVLPLPPYFPLYSMMTLQAIAWMYRACPEYDVKTTHSLTAVMSRGGAADCTTVVIRHTRFDS